MVDVTDTFTQAIYFGAGLFFINIGTGLFLAYMARKQVLASQETTLTQISCKCLFGTMSIAQIWVALAYRLSPAGRICAGDFIVNSDLMLYQENSYLIAEGKLLYFVPIIELCYKPLCCCV